MSTLQTRMGGLQFGPRELPQVVKQLMIVTAAMFLVQRIAGISSGKTFIEEYGALTGGQFWQGMVWQPFTRLFLHSEIRHLAGNLFFLWMFGSLVAQQWGRTRFLWLYLGAGALGGLLQVGLEGLLHILGVTPPLPLFLWDVPSLGASGAVFTVMTVYALTNRDRVVSFIIVPLEMEAYKLVPLMIAFEFSTVMMGLGGIPTGVSSEAHLLGILLGWLAVRLLGDGGRRIPLRSERPKGPRLRVVGRDDGPLYH